MAFFVAYNLYENIMSCHLPTSYIISFELSIPRALNNTR